MRSQSSAAVDLVAVTSAALLVRLMWVSWGRWETPDGVDYLALAHSIAFHSTLSFDGITPTSYRPPLYPTLIALLWRSSEAPGLAVLTLQAFLGAATAAVTYLMARDRFRRRTALLASLGFALGPMSSRYVATILTETLFTFFVALAVLCWGRARYSLTGILLGFAALTRQVLVPFVFLLPLTAVFRPLRPQLRSHATIFMAALVVLSPWTVRNAFTFGRLVPVADAGWGNNVLTGTVEMHLGAHPWAQVNRELHTRYADLGPDSVSRERAGVRLGIQRIWESPLRWLRARATQYPRLFIDTGEYLGGTSQVNYTQAWAAGHARVVVVKTAFALANLAVFLFAAVGLYSVRTRLPSLIHIWLFPAYVVTAHLPMWTEARFGLPMMPMVFVLAGAGAAAVWEKLRSRAPSVAMHGRAPWGASESPRSQ